jgi:hypothetical protein
MRGTECAWLGGTAAHKLCARQDQNFSPWANRVEEKTRSHPKTNRPFLWREPFLAAHPQHGKVIDACEAARISRNSAYAHRRRYPRFRKKWDRAQEAGWDAYWDARCRAWDEALGDVE